MAYKFKLKFTDNKGTFCLDNADKFKRLYFPLMNEKGFISSVTPDLKGDIKTGQSSFLNIPVSVEDLYLTQASRNFWVKINNKDVWSAAGISRQANKDKDKVFLEAGLLYHKLTRENKALKIRSEITNFVPADDDSVEIMLITITSLANSALDLECTFGMPLYCRAAETLRDHRNVTSMLNRIRLTKNSIIVRPTMLFDESGHKPNKNSYSVAGFTGQAKAPLGFFPTVLDYAGEAGDFEQPEAVFNSKQPVKKFEQGVEAVAGIRFNRIKLLPRKSCDFIILMAINQDEKIFNNYHQKYNSTQKVYKALELTKKFWTDYIEQIQFELSDKNFNNWIKWVAVQPLFRKIAGNSFMPDFDYGKGGRGWRDLWQDLLAIILINPGAVKQMLLNNFAGIRIDGSNATVIGSGPGEFIADRNNVARVWMDHGLWPYYTIRLYIDQSGDHNILFKKVKYFKDFQIKRARAKDWNWNPAQGNTLKTRTGKDYCGTILEHILVQHLVQFFNVGPHNNIRLEDADWNDGLDMAHDKGESVAFTAFYAGNLFSLAEILTQIKKQKKLQTIEIYEELKILMDKLSAGINYNSVKNKQDLLEKYLEKTKYTISGKTVKMDLDKLIRDLTLKAEWIKKHISENEWVKTRKGFQFFNGYYDNHSRKVEGDHKQGIRMTLTGQVFPIMFRMADNKKIRDSIKALIDLLWDRNLQGLRLNTDFKEVKLDMGRAFGFVYGHKENGAFFSHMNVMMANALYRNGYAREGYKVLNSIYQMWSNLDKSMIYPGSPEYYNNLGRGYYCYLTGSASWYILTLLTLVYGIKGCYGDLSLNPSLVQEQFDQGKASCITTFADKHIKVIYINKNKKDHKDYQIDLVRINNKYVHVQPHANKGVIIKRSDLLKLADKKLNIIEVELN